ncbi:DUF7289 family protein [Natronorubrum halophilum]|uniref:DUF7289 family protein n=1 Tax=Natronorubrum halophilum TaxID=1702106 RepID=UPI0010C1DBF8|nr:hypothetical protein [Natronorubrum halophilum]
MRAPRGHEPKRSSGRAQSTLIGVVLLIGMVAAGSCSILLVGGAAINGAEQQSENERVEQAFIEMSQKMTDAAVTDDTSRSIDFDVGDHGAITREDTGAIEIREASSNDPIIDDISFGSIEYTGSDGSKLAYEAGAVFREDGAETRLVSAPQFQYDEDSDTLTFPIVDIASGEQDLESGSISFENQRIDSEHRVEENQRVEIEVTSEYWSGWETYFIEETEAPWAVTTEPVDGTDKKSVTVNLGQISHPSEFSQAVRAGGDLNWAGGGAGVVDGSVMAAGSVDESGNYEDGHEEGVEPLANIDDEIAARIDETTDDYDELDPSSTIENGTYYADGDVSLGNNVDLANGDVVLVTEGIVTIDDDVLVENHDGEHAFYVYTSGGLDVANNELKPDGSGKNPARIQVYGDSSFEFTIRGNGYYEGVVYAPSSGGGSMVETAAGNPDVYGSLVGGSVELNGNPTITHNPALSDLEPKINERVQAPPDLIYLNITNHAIDITND